MNAALRLAEISRVTSKRSVPRNQSAPYWIVVASWRSSADFDRNLTSKKAFILFKLWSFWFILIHRSGVYTSRLMSLCFCSDFCLWSFDSDFCWNVQKRPRNSSSFEGFAFVVIWSFSYYLLLYTLRLLFEYFLEKYFAFLTVFFYGKVARKCTKWCSIPPCPCGFAPLSAHFWSSFLHDKYSQLFFKRNPCYFGSFSHRVSI